MLIKNSLFLYFRMFFTMLVSVYTSRVILQVLGIEDYGLYNVVGGVIVMFSFMNMSMTTATSRYLNYELGLKTSSTDSLRRVFSTCLAVHLTDAIIVLVLCETAGLYLLYNSMQIPADRFEACLVVFHTSLVALFFGILFTPFNAAIVAHERMNAFAYISIIEVILKLAIVFLLCVINADRLIVYSWLYLFVSISLSFVYVIYCWRKFPETRKLVKITKDKYVSIFCFGGWNLFGDGAYALFSNGINILLNMFFGATVNAARGIMVQVNGIAIKFTQSFQTAINPQIIKSYSSNNIERMRDLIMLSSRFTMFVLLIIIIPLFAYIDEILVFWLKNVPPYTAIFVRLMLIISIFDALGNPLTNAVNATGNNKTYQIIIGGSMLMICPIAYVCLKFGCQPYVVFIVHLFIGCIAHFLRLVIVRRKIRFHIMTYVLEVMVKNIIILFVVLGFFLFFKSNINVLLGIPLLLIITIVCVFFIGLVPRERNKVLSYIKDRI